MRCVLVLACVAGLALGQGVDKAALEKLEAKAVAAAQQLYEQHSDQINEAVEQVEDAVDAFVSNGGKQRIIDAANEVEAEVADAVEEWQGKQKHHGWWKHHGSHSDRDGSSRSGKHGSHRGKHGSHSSSHSGKHGHHG